MEASSIAWDFPSFLWQNLDAIGFLSVLSILVFTGLLECFQQRSQAKENSQLDESQLPLISLSSLTLGFLLSLHDGKQSPMTYCCVRGRVYDVSSSPNFQPGASYSFLAGADATVALAKMSYDKSLINSMDFQELRPEEWKALEGWIGYMDGKYSCVARLQANWQVPPEALSGSLLRHDGNYVAALEWASQADCDAWLGQPGMEQTRQSTVQYVVCGAVPSASSELNDKTSAGSAPQKAFARDLMDNALGGGIRSRADFEALQAPEVDPSVLFAISAGDDVDIEESDEVLISGGDPSFLNDDKWSSSSQVAEKQQKTQLDLAHTTEAEDEDDEEDVLFHGGDPTFLDDTLWGDQADKKVE
ncbi:dap1, partial [Symbiodinium necroappetens]